MCRSLPRLAGACPVTVSGSLCGGAVSIGIIGIFIWPSVAFGVIAGGLQIAGAVKAWQARAACIAGTGGPVAQAVGMPVGEGGGGPVAQAVAMPVGKDAV